MDEGLRSLIEGLRALGVTEYEGPAMPLGSMTVRLVLGAAPMRPMEPPAAVDELPASTREVITAQESERAASRDVGFGIRVRKPGAFST